MTRGTIYQLDDSGKYRRLYKVGTLEAKAWHLRWYGDDGLTPYLWMLRTMSRDPQSRR